jgi:hypothetical protein
VVAADAGVATGSLSGSSRACDGVWDELLCDSDSHDMCGEPIGGTPATAAPPRPHNPGCGTCAAPLRVAAAALAPASVGLPCGAHASVLAPALAPACRQSIAPRGAQAAERGTADCMSADAPGSGKEALAPSGPDASGMLTEVSSEGSCSRSKPEGSIVELGSWPEVSVSSHAGCWRAPPGAARLLGPAWFEASD